MERQSEKVPLVLNRLLVLKIIKKILIIKSCTLLHEIHLFFQLFLWKKIFHENFKPCCFHWPFCSYSFWMGFKDFFSVRKVIFCEALCFKADCSFVFDYPYLQYWDGWHECSFLDWEFLYIYCQAVWVEMNTFILATHLFRWFLTWRDFYTSLNLSI